MILEATKQQLADYERLSLAFDVLHGFRFIATHHFALLVLQRSYEGITVAIIAHVKSAS